VLALFHDGTTVTPRHRRGGGAKFFFRRFGHGGFQGGLWWFILPL